tara:strand:+ start:1678 stop:2409 length:732 start_codon:yes stop_codon:yes gene_type:complete
MAFKMKNPSMAKMVKQAGAGRSAMKKPLVGDQNKLNEGLKKAIEASPAKSKQDRIIKRMGKLQDKAEEANRRGKNKKAQRKIDKISKLEDKLMGAKRQDPTFEGTDEFRSKREIKKETRQQERAARKRKRQNDKTYDKIMSGKLRLTPYSKKEIRQAEREAKKKLRGQNKSSAVKLKEGEFTTSGIPANLYNADGKKISTDRIDEGNLSAVKVEKGTNRKYVVMQEKSDLGDAGARFYLKPNK